MTGVLILLRYSKEWERTVKRVGRWIDFENDYKTLDPTFMESVWWVFSTLHKKGLVYQGFKVSSANGFVAWHAALNTCRHNTCECMLYI